MDRRFSEDMDQKRNMTSREFGQFAEQMAAEHLMMQGYVIRERNWRPKNSHLEIDIIAQTGDTIVFVEVKARGSDDEDPADAVDLRKQKKLSRAADIYLTSLGEDYFYRFDIITVTGTPAHYELEHLDDAFLPPLSTF